MSTIEDEVLGKTWFYPFRLPSGHVAPTYDGGALDAIHATRLAMLQAALRSRFGIGTQLPYARKIAVGNDPESFDSSRTRGQYC